MQIIKALNYSLLTRVCQFQQRYFFTVSALWGFRLSSGANVLEQELWKEIMEQLPKGVVLDEAMKKPCAEFLVYGNACAPNGKPVERLEVDVRVAELHKRLNVYGEHHWQGSGPLAFRSKPVPFVEMPIDYQHAFGGPGHPFNPNGKGMPPADPQDPLQWLPNIEHPDDPATSPESRPLPAGFGAMDTEWPLRKVLAGTYDDHYLQHHMPGLAPDIDWQYFNVAPKDQRFIGFLQGGEPYQLNNLNAEHPVLAGRLPKVIARCLLEQRSDEVTQYHDLVMNLDTVHFFPNSDLGVLVHRGSLETFNMLGQDIHTLQIAYQAHDEPRHDKAYYLAELSKRSDPEQSFKYLLNTQALLPVSVTCGFKQIVAAQPALEQPMLANVTAYADNQVEAAKEKAEAEKEAQFAKLEEMGQKELADKMREELAKPQEMVEPTGAIKQMQDAVKAIIPDADKIKNDLDLSEVDFEALAALKEKMEAIAEEQKADAIHKVEEQLEHARKHRHEPGVERIIEELEALLAKLTLPPVLPRPEPMKLDIVLDQLRQLREEASVIKGSPQEQEDLAKHMDELDKMEAHLLSAKVAEGINEADAKIKDGYLLGAHFMPAARSPHAGEEAQRIAELLARYEAGQPLDCCDVAFGELSNGKFESATIRNSYWEYTRVRQFVFERCILSGAVFAHATLQMVSFRGCTLSGINLGAGRFEDVVFEDCDFGEVAFAHSEFVRCRFVHCTFELRQDTWLYARFRECEFVSLSIPPATFLEVDMTQCHWRNSHLPECHFIKANLNGTRFEHCDLSTVNFIDTGLSKAGFINSTLHNTRFVAGCVLESSQFDGSQATQCNFRQCRMDDSQFIRATLSKSDFGMASLQNCDFREATGFQTQFVEADLRGSHAVNANFMEASMMMADLRNASFRGANMYSVSFLKSTLGNTSFLGANLDNTLLSEWRPVLE